MKLFIRRQLHDFRNPRANLLDLVTNPPRLATTLIQQRSFASVRRQAWTLSRKQTHQHHQVRLRSYSTEPSMMIRFSLVLSKRVMAFLATTFDHKESQKALGKAYLMGIFGVTRRIKTGAQEPVDLSAEKAEDENDATGLVKQQLDALHEGDYEQDIPEAMRWFYMAASNHSDPDSQFFLGLCLHFSKVLGYEIPVREYQPDHKKNEGKEDSDIVDDLDLLAIQWFQRAADHGNHAEAQYQVGMWYISNAPQAPGERQMVLAKALTYINLAKKQGHHGAIEFLNDLNS